MSYSAPGEHENITAFLWTFPFEKIRNSKRAMIDGYSEKFVINLIAIFSLQYHDQFLAGPKLVFSLTSIFYDRVFLAEVNRTVHLHVSLNTSKMVELVTISNKFFGINKLGI